MDVVRFGVSMPGELLKEFDEYISERNYQNRSEAIRDLIRDKMVEKEWFEISEGQEVVGAITFVYNHHKRELVNSLLDVQHKYDSQVLASQHIHLDHDHCLEVTVVIGKTDKIRRIREYFHCPRCGRKGVYNIQRNYYRCRYCGFYQMFISEKTR